MLENKPVSKPPKESFGAFLGYSPPRLRVLGGHRMCQRMDTNQELLGEMLEDSQLGWKGPQSPSNSNPPQL